MEESSSDIYRREAVIMPKYYKISEKPNIQGTPFYKRQLTVGPSVNQHDFKF